MDLIISDLHFSHYKILQYENRPFNTIDEMNATIINNWNHVVNPNDRVFILGDVMFTQSPDVVINVLNQLKGRKVIILGNHDDPLKKLYRKGQYTNPKERIFIAGQIYEPKVDFGHGKFEKVVLCHYPMYSWNAAFHGRLHFYGHVHSKTVTSLNNAFNVSADIQNFTPKMFKDVIL